jgi:4'-phosphopantetheinyl transferase
MLTVEYWLISFADLTGADTLMPLLSEDERLRSQRFKFPVLQQRFVLGRGALRQILGTYLGQNPQDLQFSYGEQGKPFVEGLVFNFSHTKDWALCAVTAQAELLLGVDIESENRLSDPISLAKRFFHPQEFTYLQRCPPHQQQAIFVQFWTLKEAYLKAKGVGLQGGLDSFHIELEPSPYLVSPRGESWSFELCELVPSHQGAIAIDQAEARFIAKGEWLIHVNSG